MDDADKVAQMWDRQCIQDVILRYATGIDLRDWDLYRSIFADECEFDFSSFSGGEPETMKADDWVRRVSAMLPGFDATQHVLTNFVFVEQEPDAAVVRVYMKAEHFLTNAGGDNSAVLGGYYTHTLRRHQGDDWKIHKCHLTVTWNRGNSGLYQSAAQRVAAGTAPGATWHG